VAVACGETSNNLFFLDCLTDTAFYAACDHFDARGWPIWATRIYTDGKIWLQAI
jgi:hypothetical protein